MPKPCPKSSNDCNLVSDDQKKLLKIVTCMYKQYVACKIPNTKTFLANPGATGAQASAIAELDALSDLLATYPVLNTINPDGVDPATVRLIVTYADGKVFYDSSAASNPPVSPDNYSTRKPVQLLNTDCELVNAYQVKPAARGAGGVWVTEARIAARTGGNGVSNTGFVLLSINADIATYPFQECQCDQC